MKYPDGAIKSLDELYDCSTVYGASRYFKIVDKEERSLSLNVAHIYDYNVPKLNGYNDWFLFKTETEAKAWAEG